MIGTFIGIIPGRRRGHGRLDVLRRGAAASKEQHQFGGLDRGADGRRDRRQRRRAGRDHPVLTLAMPGSAPAAVLLAAMFIRGVRPGRMIMIEFPRFIVEVVAMILLATIAILIFGIGLTRPLLYVLAVRASG